MGLFSDNGKRFYSSNEKNRKPTRKMEVGQILNGSWAERWGESIEKQEVGVGKVNNDRCVT